MNRRDFIKLCGIVGIAAGGGYILYDYAPWLDYGTQTLEIRKPIERKTTMTIDPKELIRYATLAASGHNTQPWKFSIHDDAIGIRPDFGRRLAVVDPSDRELWISLGCALENLLIAGRASGYDMQVTYPQAEDIILIRLVKGNQEENPLYDAIPLRQNTRAEYDGKALVTQDLDRLVGMQGEKGVMLSFLTNRQDLEKVVQYVSAGNIHQFMDKQFVQELIQWVRFNKKEALATRDGLYSACSGNPQVPHWLGQIFLSTMKPQQQADGDTKKLRSSSGVVVISSDTDEKSSWVRVGQVYQRLALLMTISDIRSAFLNQPIEVASLRTEFQTALGMGRSLPQLMLRFGYGHQMPYSLRRPVEDVLT